LTEADGTSTDTSGGMSRIIEEGLLTETGERVNVSGCRLHAYPGQVQKLAVMQVEVLRGKPGNPCAALLKGGEFLVRPGERLNAKEFRDHQSGAMPSAASETGILNAGQANVGSQAARVEDSAAVGKVADSAVADSEGNVTYIITAENKDYRCVREEKKE
jgi:hypothetical protein